MFSYKLVHTCFISRAENHVSRLFMLNKAEAATKKVFYSCLKGCTYSDVYFYIGSSYYDGHNIMVVFRFLGIYSGRI